jgi:transposase
VSAFLKEIPPRLRPTIHSFTTDMWEGYLNAVEEYIAEHDDVTARLVVDRFHVAQQYRADFDDLRKQEMKRLKQELPPDSYAQDVKGTLWPLRKNHQDLDEEERIRLRRLFQSAPRLHQAYTLREELTAIFNHAQSMQEAERRLAAWIKKVEQWNATCFRPFVKTLSSHWTLIINYFADRVTSGFVEGLNNKIRTITRRCYGIRKPSTLFQRLWLDLEARIFYATKPPSTLSTT